MVVKESKVMSNEVSILHVNHTNTHDKEVHTRTFLEGNCIDFIIIRPSSHPSLNIASTSWTGTFALGFKPSGASCSLIIFFGSLQLVVTAVLTESMTTGRRRGETRLYLKLVHIVCKGNQNHMINNTNTDFPGIRKCTLYQYLHAHGAHTFSNHIIVCTFT